MSAIVPVNAWPHSFRKHDADSAEMYDRPISFNLTVTATLLSAGLSETFVAQELAVK